MVNEHLSQDDIDALLAGGMSDDMGAGDDSKSVPDQGNHLMKQTATAQPLEYSQLPLSKNESAPHNIDLILDVNVELTVELGRKRMLIKDILEVGPGSILELNKLAGEPVDLFVNNKLLARGEVVVINENFGVRIIDIIVPEQRIRNLK